jgi:cell wall-associated NlpC family hydrolase
VSPTALEMLNPPRVAPDLSQRSPAIADVTVADLRLDGRPMDAVIIDPVEVGIERRLDGASNVTLSLTDPAVGDPPRPKLLNSGIFAKAVDLDLDDLTFRLADRAITDLSGVIGLDLTFEATVVARLRTFTGAKHASRSDVTRAEFIKSLCDEAGVPFVCPDLRLRGRIQTPDEALTPAQRKAERARALNLSGKGGTAKGKTASITVKGTRATAEQLAVIQTAARAADAMRAPAKAELALFEALIVESGCRNLTGGDASSVGPLQLLAIHLGGSTSTRGGRRDVALVCKLFLTDGFTGEGGAIALARAHPEWNPGQIAAAAQGPRADLRNRYETARSEATKMLQAFGASGSLDELANTTDEPEQYAVSYMFKRLGREEAADNRDEDSWTCMRRLAEEVNWRLWEEAGSIYYMTDDRILRSAVEMTVEPMQDGIYSVTARESNRRERQEVTIECDARRWQAGPATVVEVYGYGDPLDGRWILSSIRRPSLWSPRTTITLQRREKALLEPAHELRTRADATSAATPSLATDAPGLAPFGASLPSPLSVRGRIVAIATASQTSKTGFRRYSQPGALTSDPTPAAPARTDCSQWIRACYLQAGAMDPGVNTWEMQRKGTRTSTPLPGDIMLTANVGHCEIYVGAGKTIGHGSPPIDGARVADFPGHSFVTFADLDPSKPRASTGNILDGRGGSP